MLFINYAKINIIEIVVEISWKEQWHR